MSVSEEVRLNQTRILGDGEEHKKSELCRPYSDDSRRLRESEEWLYYSYSVRKEYDGRRIKYTWYRMTKLFIPNGTEYVKKNNVSIVSSIPRGLPEEYPQRRAQKKPRQARRLAPSIHSIAARSAGQLCLNL